MNDVYRNIDFGFLSEYDSLHSRVVEKKDKLDSARPISSGLLGRIKRELSMEWTYNSNAIEGNTLSLVETRVILEDGITIGGRTMREHFEVINHEDAIQFIESLVQKESFMRCIDILSVHELVLRSIDQQFAGRLRPGMVRISGANFTPPSPLRVGELLDDLVNFVQDKESTIDSILLATVLHHRFVWIHPFVDGNGRTGRLLMNFHLMKHGYPPCIILKNDRKKYYAALNHANKGKYGPLYFLILQGVERSLNIYLNALPKGYKEYDSLTNIAMEESVPYGAEYLGLLARKGRINAHKEGRKWVTSVEDVLFYHNSLE